MNINWNKLLFKKPDKREKIVFFLMLVVIPAAIYKSYLSDDIRAIGDAKAKITAARVKPVGKTKLPTSKEKSWVGTIEAVRDAPEAALSSSSSQNVKVTKSQFSPMTPEGNRQKREVTLSAMGSYYALEQYLNYLEDMPAPLVIHNFSIQKSASSSEVLNLEISGVIYGAN